MPGTDGGLRNALVNMTAKVCPERAYILMRETENGPENGREKMIVSKNHT